MTILKYKEPKNVLDLSPPLCVCIVNSLLWLKFIRLMNKFTWCTLFIGGMGHIFKKKSDQEWCSPEAIQPIAIKMQNAELLLGRRPDVVLGTPPDKTHTVKQQKDESEAENVPRRTPGVLPLSRSALSRHRRLELLLLDSAGTKVCGWRVSTNKPKFSQCGNCHRLSLLVRIRVVLWTVISGTFGWLFNGYSSR